MKNDKAGITSPAYQKFSGITDEFLAGAVSDGARALIISSDRITVRGLQFIANWPIETLSLLSCSRVRRAEIEAVVSMSQLKGLALDGCLFLTDADLEPLRQNIALRALSVKWCYNLTDVTCETLGSTQIEHLDIDGCEKIGDRGLGFLAMNTHLQTLYLASEGPISDYGLKIIATKMGALKSLSFNGLDHVTDAGILGLKESTSLDRIVMSHLSNVTMKAVEALKAELPHTTILFS